MDALNHYPKLFPDELQFISSHVESYLEIREKVSAAEEDYTEYDWFGEARIQETAGNSEGALEAFSESIKLNPNFAKAWYYKALLHYELGQKEEALECAKKALELKPTWEKHIRKNLPDLEL